MDGVIMIKDYWFYQERKTTQPWALYFVKVYPRTNSFSERAQETFFDWTIYHDAIGNDENAKSGINLHCNTISEYVEFIADELAKVCKVTAADRTQLYDIFMKMLYIRD